MKKNVVISMLVIALAAALLGGATYAWFTSEKDFDAAFTAGTLVLNADGADIEFENIAPGWGTDEEGDFTWEVTLENDGTLDMYYRVYFEEVEEPEYAISLADVLKVRICFVDGEEELLDYTALSSLSKDDFIKLDELEATESVALKLYFQLPTDVGNEYQGASWSGKLYAQGTQKDHQDDGDIQWSN